jgi:pimeloyl-ACP methyl ester carboxylesterase
MGGAARARGFNYIPIEYGRGRITSRTRFLRRLIERIQTENLYLAGFSCGGATALKLAASFPDKIKGCVVINAPLSFCDLQFTDILQDMSFQDAFSLYGLWAYVFGGVDVRRDLPSVKNCYAFYSDADRIIKSESAAREIKRLPGNKMGRVDGGHRISAGNKGAVCDLAASYFDDIIENQGRTGTFPA